MNNKKLYRVKLLGFVPASTFAYVEAKTEAQADKIVKKIEKKLIANRPHGALSGFSSDDKGVDSYVDDTDPHIFFAGTYSGDIEEIDPDEVYRDESFLNDLMDDMKGESNE